MPVHLGYEKHNGKKMGYYQWGGHGKKYYFTPGNTKARKKARKKAQKQGRAAYASGYNG